MTTLRTAAQQALEAMRCAVPTGKITLYAWDKAMAALRAALAEPVQEPAAWQERQAKRMRDGIVTEWTDWYPCQYRTADKARAEVCDQIPYEWRPLYTAPPQRKPLTEEEIRDLWSWAMTAEAERTATTQQHAFARAIERAHGVGGDE